MISDNTKFSSRLKYNFIVDVLKMSNPFFTKKEHSRKIVEIIWVLNEFLENNMIEGRGWYAKGGIFYVNSSALLWKKK